MEIEKELRRGRAELKRIVGSKTKKSAMGSRLAELQGRMSVAEERLTEIKREIADLERECVADGDIVAALAQFEPLWDSLSPREQARIIELLIERVAYDGAEGKIADAYPVDSTGHYR